MFHTFEGFENPTAATPARAARPPNPERRDSVTRRVTTLRACTSCRHRKIKCDGEKPCEACRWYKKADQCHYSDPRPSRRHVEKLSTTLDEYRSILSKLFPNIAPESLVNLSREKLLELATGTSSAASLAQAPHSSAATHQAPHPASPATSGSVEAHVSPLSNEDDNLESLQSMMFSPPEPARLNTAMGENGPQDPLAPNFVDDSGQYLWEYLSWSDQNMWPGISDVDARSEAMALLTPDHEKGPKFGAHPYFEPIPDSYFANPPAFYQ